MPTKESNNAIKVMFGRNLSYLSFEIWKFNIL